MVFVGSSKTVAKETVLLPLEKLVLKYPDEPRLEISIIDSTDNGVRLMVGIEGGNSYDYCKRTLRLTEAKQEYAKIVEKIQKGEYRLKIYPLKSGEMELELL